MAGYGLSGFGYGCRRNSVMTPAVTERTNDDLPETKRFNSVGAANVGFGRSVSGFPGASPLASHFCSKEKPTAMVHHQDDPFECHLRIKYPRQPTDLRGNSTSIL